MFPPARKYKPIFPASRKQVGWSSSQPCGSTACPRPCMFPPARKYKPIFPASRKQVGWSSSRTGRISPWAAPCSPWCSCTSLPSWGESSSQAHRSSLARSDSSVLPLGRGKCWRTSRSTCAVSLADLDLDLSRNVITLLGWCLAADNSLGSVPIVLGGLVPLAIKLHGVCAGNIIDHLLLHIAIRGLHVCALVVVLGGHVDLVGGVAYSVLAGEASLYLVSLLEGLVVNGFHQVTHKLVHIKTNTLNVRLDYSSTIVERLGNAGLPVLSPTRLLDIGLALVLEHHLLHHVTVGVLVHTISSHISLPYIRIVLLGRSRCRILWRREGKHHRQA